MDPVILTWRPQNLLTIFLMILVIGVFVALIGQAFHMGSAAASSYNTGTNPQQNT